MSAAFLLFFKIHTKAPSTRPSLITQVSKANSLLCSPAAHWTSRVVPYCQLSCSIVWHLESIYPGHNIRVTKAKVLFFLDLEP
jgi:hypothetical protein